MLGLLEKSCTGDLPHVTDDADGNMTSRTLASSGDVTGYVWNDFNNLIGLTLNGTSQESDFYDTDGLRRIRNDGSKYYNSGSVELAENRPTSGQVSFIQGHQVLGLQEGGSLYFFLTDGLSSVRQVIDHSGTIQATFATDEYGVPNGSLITGSAELLANTYVGGLGVRNETGQPSGIANRGLYYMQQRWYDPGAGRFLNRDPIGFSGGLNLYAYTGGSPTNYVDPRGLDVIVADPQTAAQLQAILAKNPALAGGVTAQQMYNSFQPGKSGSGVTNLTVYTRSESSPIPAVTVPVKLTKDPLTQAPCHQGVFVFLFGKQTKADNYLYLLVELGNAYAVLNGTVVGGDLGPTDVQSNWFAVQAAAANPEILKAAQTGGVTNPMAAGAIKATASGEIKTQADFVNWMQAHSR